MPKPKPDFEYIAEQLVPEWIEQFGNKNKDYGDDSNSLGVKGAFVDIWRKTLKLRRGIWDDQRLIGEQPRELLMDLIGHCFLTIAGMDQQDRIEVTNDQMSGPKMQCARFAFDLQCVLPINHPGMHVYPNPPKE
jgi:hypothetical protein